MFLHSQWLSSLEPGDHFISSGGKFEYISGKKVNGDCYRARNLSTKKIVGWGTDTIVEKI